MPKLPRVLSAVWVLRLRIVVDIIPIFIIIITTNIIKVLQILFQTLRILFLLFLKVISLPFSFANIG